MPDAQNRPPEPTKADTPYIRDAAARIASGQTEADARAVRARRDALRASYRSDGFSELYIETHVTDAAAARMVDYERKTVDAIAGLFSGARS